MSLRLAKILAESGDGKEELESKASHWRFAVLVLKVGQKGSWVCWT